MATFEVTSNRLTVTEITCDAWYWTKEGRIKFVKVVAESDPIRHQDIAYFWRPISVILKEDAE